MPGTPSALARRCSSLFAAALLAGVVAGVVAFSACDAQNAPETAANKLALDQLPPAVRAKTSEGVLAALVRGQAQNVLVELDEAVIEKEAPQAEPFDIAVAEADEARRSALFAAVKHDVMAGAPNGVTLVDDYDHLPIAYLRVDSLAAMAGLLGDHRIAFAHENLTHEHTDAASFALINQPQALAAGRDGAGTAVAVLDTGCDYQRVAFGPCTAPGDPTCKVAFARDFAPDDGALDDDGHGTNVAGIVAGVAPGARVLALDVFNGPVAYSNDIAAALNWVIANRAAYNIVAINLSLGRGRSSAACGQSPFAYAVATARSLGVLAAISSGNNGYTDSLLAPACIPGAVSVGAVYSTAFAALTWGAGCTDTSPAADEIPCFSNSSSLLTLLAPGAMITAAGATMGGTSQAAAHVAGAIAVLRGAFPDESMDQIVTRMTATGKPIVDARNNLTVPRLDLGAAAAGCIYSLGPANQVVSEVGGPFGLALDTAPGCQWAIASDSAWIDFPGGASGAGAATITGVARPNGGLVRGALLTISGDGATRTVRVSQGADGSPPRGTLAINGGAPATRVPLVALAIAASDPSGVTQMCISNSVSCAAWEAFGPTKSWTIGGGNGAKTVYVLLRDARGNTTDAGAVSATITIDTVAPANGTVVATPDNLQTTLEFKGFSDALSGVAGYQVAFAEGNVAPASCAAGTLAYSGPAPRFVHGGLTNGAHYAYRVCGVDGAGNVGTGVTVVAMPRPESNPPTGTVAINGGASTTRSAAVTLTLLASDDTDVTQMCISTTGTCNAWEKYSASKNFALLASAGAHTVNAWFMDTWTNVTPMPTSATIFLDSTAPTNGTVAAVGSTTQVALSWKGFADAGSGIASYVVMYAVGAPPASCGAGSLAWSGNATSFTHTNLVDGTVYGYRVCAVDGAGNTSTGVATTARPAPEYDPPVGAVAINGGAPVTRDFVVTLAIDAADASGVTDMCVSNTNACVAWEPWAASKAFALTNPPGVRTVSVWLRDVYGNVTPQPATANILFDNLVPTGGVLKLVPSDQQVRLSWSGFIDSLSGVGNYIVTWGPGPAPPSCAAGNIAYTGSDTTFAHAGLANGTRYAYRVCAVDKAGNVSAGVTGAATPAPEFDPPVGTVTINGGDAFTGKLDVALSLAANDASGVAQMCLSNTRACSAWESYAANRPYSLVAEQGAHTVFAWFRDVYGNTTPLPVSATISVDSMAPIMGTVTATPGAGQVALGWLPATDGGVGVSSYVLVYQEGAVAPPTACGTGTQLYVGPDLAFTHTGLAAGTQLSYRLCALDKLGNTSLGLARTAVVQ